MLQNPAYPSGSLVGACCPQARHRTHALLAEQATQGINPTGDAPRGMHKQPRLADLISCTTSARRKPKTRSIRSAALWASLAAPTPIMIIYRESGDVVLAAKGRDIEEIKKATKFDRGTCLWTITGDADQVRLSAERIAVVKALEEAAADPLTPQQIASETQMKVANIKMLHRSMVKDGIVHSRHHLRHGWVILTLSFRPRGVRYTLHCVAKRFLAPE
jgi:hypothetical protein